ncbi:hypothetical protein GGR58DRAFT_492644 [Xylaria digitata]|nr:hypothetical protein GGR58DRAFT_492644 [Xylaria digitata]
MALPFSRPSILPPGFTMSRCTPADVQGMNEVYMDAFSNSEYTYWWGPSAAMWSWSAERIRRRFADAGTQQFKVVDDTNGTIVAWAKWDPPSRMIGLRDGFVVYDEAGDSVGADSKGGEGKEKGEADGKTSGKSYALSPPEGSNIPLFQKFFDEIVSMGKKHQASEKLDDREGYTRPFFHFNLNR